MQFYHKYLVALLIYSLEIYNKQTYAFIFMISKRHVFA